MHCLMISSLHMCLDTCIYAQFKQSYKYLQQNVQIFFIALGLTALQIAWCECFGNPFYNCNTRADWDCPASIMAYARKTPICK